jgi:SP family galactose:H+ symporter-like MFS transporter
MFSLVKPYLALAISSAAVAGLLFGINTGNIAGALPFIQQQFHTTTLQNELIVSATILFAFISAVVSSRVSETYGHRKVLLYTGILFVMGSLQAGYAQSIFELICARSILGIAIGISSYAAPLYIAEIAPTQYRGFFVLLNGLAITGGEALAFYVDYLYGQQNQWRPMLWWSVYPALIFTFSILLMPCAPRWLLSRGNLTAATHALKKFHPQKAISALMKEMQSITVTLPLNLWQLLAHKAYRRPLIIAITLGVFQQFFGINAVMYYGPYIFAKAGFALKGSAIWVTFIMGTINMIVTLIVGFFVDSVGRRVLLLWGSGLAFFSLLMIAASFNSHTMNAPQSFSVVIFMVMYIIGYCMSVGSLFWLIIAEIFPLAMRDKGASLATGIQWLANFVVSITFLTMLEHWGAGTTFFSYALICLMAMLFVYRYVPETKGLSLEEIAGSC